MGVKHPKCDTKRAQVKAEKWRSERPWPQPRRPTYKPPQIVQWEGNDETLRTIEVTLPQRVPARPHAQRSPAHGPSEVPRGTPPPRISAMGATHARPTKRNPKDGSGGAVSISGCGCAGGGGEAAQARKLRDLQKRFRKSDFDGSGGISTREMCR